MPHRAIQILDAIDALLAANSNLGAAVFKQRAETLSYGEQELPAVAVMMGDDDPPNELGAVNLTFLDSLLAVTCSAVNTAASEPELIAALLEMRRQIHITLMADRTLGLGFVIDVRYQGAVTPEINTAGEYMVGRVDTRWAVHYRMNTTDPA
jgi:hypothetical protein